MKVSSPSSVLARTFVAFVLLLLLAAAMAIMPGSVSAAFAAGIADVAWNESNVGNLRSLDQAAVEEFVNQLSEGDVHKTLGEFTWADLAVDKRYELVATLDLSGRGFFDYLAVYTRQDSGNINVQWFPEETSVGKLSRVIRDLDGDGKDELIIPTLFPSGSYGAAAVNAVWAAVYKLKNGTYVEASKEFGSFYDADVLPQLEKDIAESRAKMATSPSYVRKLISQTLERDKILRVLGRDPSAGLNDAREWAGGSDPNLASAGTAVLQDIGGKGGKVSKEKDVPKRVELRESN